VHGGFVSMSLLRKQNTTDSFETRNKNNTGTEETEPKHIPTCFDDNV